MADDKQADPSATAHLTLTVFKHAIPITQAFDFHKVFGKSVVVKPSDNNADGKHSTADIHALLRSATQRREEVRQALAGANMLAAAQLICGHRSEAGQSISKCVSAASSANDEAPKTLAEPRQDLTSSGAWDAQHAQQGLVSVGEGGYLSWFSGLHQATEGAPASLMAAVRFIWTTPVSMRNARNPCVDPAFGWEATMLCVSLGVCLRNLASERLAASQAGGLREVADAAASIATLLQRAAGVFAYCRDVILVNWTTRPTLPLAEAEEGLFNSLEQLCIAEAQSVTAIKAISNNMKSELVAKLLWGAADTFVSASKSLAALRGADAKNYAQSTVNPQLLKYAQLSGDLWRAQAHSALARSAFDAQSFGLAVAHSARAVSLLPPIKATALPQGLDKFRQRREALHRTLVAEHAMMDRENSTIYYESVPDPEIPQARMMAKRIDFAPPIQPLSIELRVSDGSACAIM